MTQNEYNLRWAYLVRTLLRAKTKDLRSGNWNVPEIDPGWALRVQQMGFDMYGDDFWFIAYDLEQFCNSKLESRSRATNSGLIFAASPFINTDLVVYSGTADPEFAAYRLGTEIAAPFKDYIFTHPETRWYNIASRIGMKRYFPKNAPQILDFFSGLIAMRLKKGKRPLLVSKKAFVGLCSNKIVAGLKELGVKGVHVVTKDFEETDLDDHNVIPLINYGIVGTNLFENFDAVFCLNGYYVNEYIVNSILQDILAPDFEIAIEIGTHDRPLRRWAGVKNPSDRHYDIHRLAPMALNQQELDIVLQAVGRVRPYTKPREVITFQCAANPQLTYTKEFQTLEECRRFFGVPKRREKQQTETRMAVVLAKGKGLTQRQVAGELGLSLRTVQRYWKK
jgi:hypothetical protein